LRQIIPGETGEVQLALVGKGNKPRRVPLPADLAKSLRAIRGDAPNSARVFPITERRINYILKAVASALNLNRARRRIGCARPRLARDRQRGADHARVADAWPGRLEDDERLCAC
jgi:integrase